MNNMPQLVIKGLPPDYDYDQVLEAAQTALETTGYTPEAAYSGLVEHIHSRNYLGRRQALEAWRAVEEAVTQEVTKQQHNYSRSSITRAVYPSVDFFQRDPSDMLKTYGTFQANIAPTYPPQPPFEPQQLADQTEDSKARFESLYTLMYTVAANEQLRLYGLSVNETGVIYGLGGMNITDQRWKQITQRLDSLDVYDQTLERHERAERFGEITPRWDPRYGIYPGLTTRFNMIQDVWEIDPEKTLHLTEIQRKAMNDEAAEHFFTEAKRILADYPIETGGDGDIIDPVGTIVEIVRTGRYNRGRETTHLPSRQTVSWESVRGKLLMIDFDPIIDKYMSMPTLYTKPGCGPCLATERQFKQHGIEYKKIDVTQDPEALAYVTETLGYQSVPVVETASGEHWSGHKHEQIADLAPNRDDDYVLAAPSGRNNAVTVIAQTQHIDISNQTPDTHRQL